MIAVPFVQGKLRNESLTVNIKTECQHCGKPIHLELNNNLEFNLEQENAAPMLVKPIVDFAKLKEPNIINAF